MTAGGLKCWGGNQFGQLGDGTNVNRSAPVDVVGLASGVAAIAVGGDHTCALATVGGLKCWGWDGAGQLGDGPSRGTSGTNSPVDVVGFPGLVATPTTAGGVATASFTVTSTADAADASPGDGVCDDGTGSCTLRAAIMEANAVPGADAITLPSGSYALATAGTGEDEAATGDLDITDDLTIEGAGAATTIIDGGGFDRVFHILADSTVAISGVAVQNGNATVGGGIRNFGTLTVANSSLINNNAVSNGGGIDNTATVTLTDTLVSGNTADSAGGIVNRGKMTLNNTIVSGNTAADVAGGMFNVGTLDLTNGTVSDNAAAEDGGGIHNKGTMTVINVTISGNTASVGGGIHNEGTLALSDSSVNDNQASHAGGINNRATLTVNKSVISNNSSDGEGGGIYSGGALTIANSTVSGNTAGFGGGIYSNSNKSEVISTTVSNNTAGVGGGLFSSGVGSAGLTVTNTIIANSPSGGDCSGSFTSLGHNLDSDSTCNLTETTDLPGVDPLLGPLARNGGPTSTHALMIGSPAIDAGDDAVAPPTDQRGASRPQGSTIDIGAYEGSVALVNSANDVDDGTCNGTHCSLREAINAANANNGTDTIAFNIPGPGPHTIRPNAALPTITDPVVIDGYTQPGATPNTNGPGLGLNTVLKIELDGSSAGTAADGLTITAGSSTVRGLVINRFSDNGMELLTSGGNVIEGNFIGTDVSGAFNLGNRNGMFIDSGSNTIGGGLPGARNVISANSLRGIFIQGSNATGNVVQGNFVGSDAGGTVSLPQVTGVLIAGPNNTVGGTTPEARNVISGNSAEGVRITGAVTTGNLVQGNFIGTDVTGALDLGNFTGDGVEFAAAAGNTIGGTVNGAGNVIAFSGQAGVDVSSSSGRNAILGNSIFSNAGLGIDLGASGITHNDAGDNDTGANNLQNFPVLTSATASGGTITIGGTLSSAASTDFRVEFFANTACDPSGFGEGETFLGATTVTTDSGGDASFSVALTKAVSVGKAITTTATDPGGNTSEFSGCITAGAGWMPVSKLNNPRIGHVAVLLDDGMVLIVGDNTDAGPPFGTNDAAELYDPATRSFTFLGSVPFRQGVGATKLADGSVLLVGGGSPGTVTIYDPVTRQFKPTGSLNVARTSSSVTLLADGKVLVAGGSERRPDGIYTVAVAAVAEVYDPATGIFTLTGSLNQHRRGHAAVLLPNGKVLIVGGFQATASRGIDLELAELYDPEMGDFSVIGETVFRGSSAVLLNDGRVLIASGAPVASTGVLSGGGAEIFDSDTNSFSRT